MEILLSAIMAALMTAQTTDPVFRNNSLYAFNIDPATSDVVVMNTQTGHLYRCNKNFECDGGLDLKPREK
jgi:hypothetical protein